MYSEITRPRDEGALESVSKNKRSEMMQLTQIHADAAIRFIKTLRRFKLAKPPTGRYKESTDVFNVWNFAKKYGVVPGVKNKE